MSGASTLSAPANAHVAHAAHRVVSDPIVLNGRTTNLVIADRQGIAHVTGKGHLSGLGKVTVSSSVNTKSETPLLSSPWLLYANLVIAAPKGQINVHVTPGTIGLNPFSQPVHMQYSIRGGTGAFRHATGKGLVEVTLYQGIPTTLAQLKQMGVEVDTKGVPFALHFHPGHLNKWGDFSSMWYNIIRTVAHKSTGHARRPAGKTGK